MFERFTEKAIKVIMLAQEEARLMGHNFVGTEQILLGLCGEGTGIAARVLRAHNVKLKDLRTAVREIIGTGKDIVAVEVPFTPRAKFLLEAAWNAAREGHNYIGTEHLLLGLLAVDGGVAKQVLNDLNVDLAKVRIDVLDLIQIASKQQQVTSANPTHALVSTHDHAQVQSQAVAVAPVQTVRTPAAKPSVVNVFSESAIKSMQLAQEEAHRVGSTKLELQHLLLGILAEGSSEAAKLLAAQTVKLEDLRLATTPEDEEKLSESASLDFELSSQVFIAVDMASVAARTSGSSVVTPEHLLFALLSYEESRAIKGLQKLGVNIELFVNELRKVIRALAVKKDKVAEQEKCAEAAKAAGSVTEEKEKKADTADLPQATLALTEMVEHAIVLAREEAHRLGHVEVDTDHLLLGLMAEADGLASLALHVWDVKTKELRQESENMPGREKCDSLCESRCGSKVNELILTARQLAREAKRSYVGTDQVLLALLADEDSAGLKVLHNLSIDIDRLKKTLQNANTAPQVGGKYSALVPLSKQIGFERFSDEAIKVMMFAKEEASRLGHSQIDSQFLLLGICDERLNKGAERLRKIGISLDDLRFEVERLTGYGDGDCGSEIVFGKHALQAMCWSFDTVVASGIADY